MKATRHQPDQQVIFIDSSLPDYQTLIDSLPEGMEVVRVNPDQDGIQVMGEWAAKHSDYDAIHILGHGSEGAQQLGNATLSNETLATYQAELSQVGKALTEDGDILPYGCNVAVNQTGVDFIGKLAQATGADVAASDDLTGSTEKGGDWELEVQTGPVIQELAANALSSYGSVLAVAWTNVTGTGNVAASLSSNSYLNMVGDFDSDGDYDFVAASNLTEYTYFRNNYEVLWG